MFGKRSTENVDLAALGGGGFEVVGPSIVSSAGESVDGAGDVDGDGLHDVVVGAPGADAVYLVFGTRSAEPGDLAAPGAAALDAARLRR